MQKAATKGAILILLRRNCSKILSTNCLKKQAKRLFVQKTKYAFSQIGCTLFPYQLSSGEKQILAILLTVLVQDGKPYVLFMDEPEVSLHVDWQKKLIALIMSLNPNVQIILSTHSPAVIMDGWIDKVTEVDEITIG